MKTNGIGRRIGAAVLAAAVVSLAHAQGQPGVPASADQSVRTIRALFAQGRWADAVNALEREAVRQPDQEDLLFLRAMVAMELGDYGGAARLYQKLLDRYPDNPGLKNNMAWLRIKSSDPAIRDLDRALREAQEAIMAAPQDYNIWNTLGEIHLARGDVMQAMRVAVLSRDLATLAGERDLRLFQDLVRRCETAPEKTQ